MEAKHTDRFSNLYPPRPYRRPTRHSAATSK